MNKIRLSSLLGAMQGAAMLFAASVSLAQTQPAANNNFWFDPVLGSELVPPSNFAGLYAGVAFGMSNQNLNTFYTPADPRGPALGGLLFGEYRLPAGVIVGYNHQIAPQLMAGVELQGAIAFDWTAPAHDFRIVGLGRLGYLLNDTLAVYQMAGLGLINGRSAYAVGLGFEQAVAKDFSVRAEALAFGQLVPPVGVTNSGGFTMLKVDAGIVWHINSDATAQPAPAYLTSPASSIDFTGPYLGAYAGAVYNTSYNFFNIDPVLGWHPGRFAQGVLAGWNYALTDNLRAGVEIQAGINFDTAAGASVDAQILARAGVVPVQGAMIYGTAGVGILANRAAYVAGGGIEYAFWGKNTLRLDAQFMGEIQPAPPIIQSGFSATKVTLGALWHLD